jgi:hypothetical protein
VADAERAAGDRGCGLLVGEHLGGGQAGGVVDGDAHVVPTDRLAFATFGVGAVAAGVGLAAGDALAGAAVDASELLD